MGTQWEGGHLYAERGALRRKQTHLHLDLGLLTPQSGEKTKAVATQTAVLDAALANQHTRSYLRRVKPVKMPILDKLIC